MIQKSSAKLQKEVDKFNKKFKIGDPIVYYEIWGQKEPPLKTTTQTEAYVLSGHTAVVFLNGKRGCVVCSHCVSVAEYDKAMELARQPHFTPQEDSGSTFWAEFGNENKK